MANNFCWMELITHDFQGARAFYGEMFGWDLIPMEGAPVPYLIVATNEEPGGAIMARPEPGIPTAWSAYVRVADIDAAMVRVDELGGKVWRPKQEVPGFGWFAVACDPQGGFFCLWQNAPGAVAPPMEAKGPNPFCCVELMTYDPAGARAFYGGLFDWKFSELPNPSLPVTGIDAGQPPMGTIVPIVEPGIPVHWLVFMAVENLDSAVARVGRLGGKVWKERTEVPGAGAFAVACDPQGGYFGLWQNA